MIAVNIGNTNTTFAFVQDDGSLHKVKVHTHSYTSAEELEKILLKQPFKLQEEALLIASVVKDKNKIFSKINPQSVFVSEKDLNDINIDRYPQGQLGIDRLVAMNALAKENDFILFDFGTATTVNVVKNKKFLGGTILCGMRTGINALFNNTHQLNQVHLKSDAPLIATDTESAMQAGALHGSLALIHYFVAETKKKYHTDFKVFITGGNARYFINHLEDVHYSPDLILNYLMTRGDLYAQN